ncbi:hypothetical protein AAMO2058_001264600 [Amorphochlora amoebiformis]
MISTHGYFYNHPEHHPDWRNDTWVFSLKDHWFREVNIKSTHNPQASFYPSTVEYEGNAYMFGGDHMIGDGRRGHTFGLGSNEVWKLTIDPISFGGKHFKVLGKYGDYFAPITGRWDLMHSGKASEGLGPSPRACHTAAVLNRKMYIHAGFDRSDMWAYTFATNQWEQQHTDNPTGGPGSRFAHAMVAHNGKLWMYGGNIYGVSDKARSDLWTFDPSTKIWKFIANKPSSEADTWPAVRAHHAFSYEAGDRPGLYVMGGLRCPDGPCKCRDDTWRYDFETGTWTELAADQAPIPRYSHAMVYSEDHLYVFGGESMKPYMYHNEVKVLNVRKFGFGTINNKMRDDL